MVLSLRLHTRLHLEFLGAKNTALKDRFVIIGSSGGRQVTEIALKKKKER